MIFKFHSIMKSHGKHLIGLVSEIIAQIVQKGSFYLDSLSHQFTSPWKVLVTIVFSRMMFSAHWKLSSLQLLVLCRFLISSDIGRNLLMEQKKLNEYLPMSIKCEHCGSSSTYYCEKIICFKPVSYQTYNSLYQKFCASKHHALAIERRSVNSSIPHGPQHLAGAHQINSFVFNEKINDRHLKNPEVCIISLMTHPLLL